MLVVMAAHFVERASTASTALRGEEMRGASAGGERNIRSFQRRAVLHISWPATRLDGIHKSMLNNFNLASRAVANLHCTIKPPPLSLPARQLPASILLAHDPSPRHTSSIAPRT
jgi:hypothetical protein